MDDGQPSPTIKRTTKLKKSKTVTLIIEQASPGEGKHTHTQSERPHINKAELADEFIKQSSQQTNSAHEKVGNA